MAGHQGSRGAGSNSAHASRHAPFRDALWLFGAGAATDSTSDARRPNASSRPWQPEGESASTCLKRHSKQPTFENRPASRDERPLTGREDGADAVAGRGGPTSKPLASPPSRSSTAMADAGSRWVQRRLRGEASPSSARAEYARFIARATTSIDATLASSRNLSRLRDPGRRRTSCGNRHLTASRLFASLPRDFTSPRTIDRLPPAEPRWL
jgi:hypothetical protein